MNPTTASMDEATLQSDLEALVRVRNRLAHAPDSDLPKILSGLLPRLLERLERNHDRIGAATTAASNATSSTSAGAITEDEKDKLQAQLTGILSHALDRIRGGHQTSAPWIHTLLPLLQKDWHSPVAITFLLLILQNSLPRYAGSIYYDNCTTSNNNSSSFDEQPDIVFTALPACSQFVNTLHHKILAAASEKTSRGSSYAAIPESMLLNFRTGSWLCFDVLALGWGLPALIDWDRDHFDEYEWSTPCCSTPKEAFLEHGPSRHQYTNPSQTTSVVSFLEHLGSFQLWLDLLLFWPTENNQRHRRVVRTADELLVENNTGMTSEGRQRLNHRCKGQSWNARYLRELKLACMHCVVVAPLRYLHGTLDDLEDNVSLLRSLLLCILTASSGSMHGKVAMEYVNKVSSQFATKSCRAQLPTSSDPWACAGDTSLVLACSLLTLVLGDEMARSILEKHPEGRAKIEAILGPFPARRTTPNDNDNTAGAAPAREDDNAPSNILQRAPMPFGVAERAVGFILTRLLPPSAEEGAPPLSLNALKAKGSEMGSHFGTLLPAFVDLVVALSTSKGAIGSYWAIQCLDGLYTQLSASCLSSSNFDGMAGLFEDGWIREFYITCLDIASHVLSQIAEVDAETMVMLGDIQHPHERNQMLPGGVPGPFGRRRDLNMMLAQHRNSQKKRQLRVDCALRARKQAYRMATELASSNMGVVDAPSVSSNEDKKSSPVLDMPIILLKCATGEEDTSMHPYVTQALESWLTVYKKSLLTVESSRLKTRVASLLPSLLYAVISECGVARLSAVRWVVEFVHALDPAVTLYVCTFLVDDVDPFVSALAKKALMSMKRDTPMEDIPGSYHINFLDLTGEEDTSVIKADLDSLIQRTASSLDMPVSVSRVILGDFRFDVDKAVEGCNADRETTLQQCGLSCRSERIIPMSEISGNSSHSGDFCGICYDEVDKDEVYEMPCEHKFCLSCWHSYVSCALNERPTAVTTVLSITCPEQDCNERVVKEDVQAAAPDMLRQWEGIELRSFIGCSKNYSSCPGPDCKAVAHISLAEGKASHPNPTMLCEQCKTSFCFCCGSDPHQPAKCADFAEWNRIFGSSQFWVKKNAKPCPGCKVPIEKNNGCNHIRCSQCGHDFCWLCLGPLRTHMEPHICNRYEPHKSAEDEEERRALFFTDRFKAHDDAEMFAKEEVRSLEERMEKLSAETLWFASDDDLDSMLNAAKTLVRARNFLKNSYVAAWAMRKDLEHRDVFDCHQANLELFTEKLSELLLTKVHQLYAEQGARAIHMHFRAMLFSTTSVVRYMGRIMAFVDSN